MNAYVPTHAALGPARIELNGAVSVATALQSVAPGVFTLTMSGGGAPVATLDPDRLTVYTTGLARATTARLTLGGQPLEDVTVSPVPDLPGVERVSARLPAGFRLAGYLPLELSVADAKANVTTVRIKAK